MKEDNSKEAKINEEAKELVITRIDAAPSDLRLSVGGGESMTKEKMIEHVRKGDKIGRQIIKMHLSFIKAAASGEVGQALASV
ncbi:MAG: hypothetical protein IIA87_05000 [Nanoarchaeota archaeon]|nr:hypothetical protein [Nanoarchaeota archaeon]